MHTSSKKILIVDSNEAIRKSLREFITSLGHEVLEAMSGVEAINMASSISPAVIMIDVCLPEISGDEVTVRLKRNIATRSIPVVISAGWTTDCNVEERIDRALNAGAAEVLYKPFQLPILRDVLRAHLHG